MGIHYDYKSTKGNKLMEKQAKREKKLAEKKAKRLAKEGPKEESPYEMLLPLTCFSSNGVIIPSSFDIFLIHLSERTDIIYFSFLFFFEKVFFSLNFFSTLSLNAHFFLLNSFFIWICKKV